MTKEIEHFHQKNYPFVADFSIIKTKTGYASSGIILKDTIAQTQKILKRFNYKTRSKVAAERHFKAMQNKYYAILESARPKRK